MADLEKFNPIIFSELDPVVTFSNQVRSDFVGEVVLMGTYVFASEGELNAFIGGFHGHSDFMRSKSGFISAQLHRAIGGANVLVINATWKSAAAFHAAFQAEEEKLAELNNAAIGGLIDTSTATIGRRVLVEKIFGELLPNK